MPFRVASPTSGNTHLVVIKETKKYIPNKKYLLVLPLQLESFATFSKLVQFVIPSYIFSLKESFLLFRNYIFQNKNFNSPLLPQLIDNHHTTHFLTSFCVCRLINHRASRAQFLNVCKGANAKRSFGDVTAESCQMRWQQKRNFEVLATNYFKDSCISN